MQNIHIIGTSHIAKESLQYIERGISQYDPEIIAVELDVHRYRGLISQKKHKLKISDILKIGVTGFIFALIGKFVQNRLGKVVNMEPGADMLGAVKFAKKMNLQVALIDQDIQVTLRRLTQMLSWKERLNFAIDMVKGILFPKSEIRKLGIENMDLTKVPDKKLIKVLVKIMKDRYPNVYRVLLTERNKVMVDRLKKIIEDNPTKTVLAVVGAAHVDGMLKLLELDRESPSYSFSTKWNSKW